jgi:hypothetical protein
LESNINFGEYKERKPADKIKEVTERGINSRDKITMNQLEAKLVVCVLAGLVQLFALSEATQPSLSAGWKELWDTVKSTKVEKGFEWTRSAISELANEMHALSGRALNLDKEFVDTWNFLKSLEEICRTLPSDANRCLRRLRLARRLQSRIADSEANLKLYIETCRGRQEKTCSSYIKP